MTVDHSVTSVGRFLDFLDGTDRAGAGALAADDLQFEVMLPPRGGRQAERFVGGAVDVNRTAAELGEGDSRLRHELDTVVESAGIELAVGHVVGGDQPRTFMAVAQAGDDGRVRRFVAVESAAVQFSEGSRRQEPPPDLLARYFDRVDAILLEEPVNVISERFNFEMVFPGIDGEPDERILRDMADFRRFQAGIRARRPRPTTPVAPEDRRHHTLLTEVADGLVLVLADTRNGRRNGTILAAAESDADGRMLRYLIGMAPTVHFEPRRTS